MVGAGQIQSFYAPMGVFSAIYVIDDHEHMAKVIASPVWTDLMKGLAEKAKNAFFDESFKFAGTGMESYAKVGQTRFVPVSYKKDWANVREVDAALLDLVGQKP